MPTRFDFIFELTQYDVNFICMTFKIMYEFGTDATSYIKILRQDWHKKDLT